MRGPANAQAVQLNAYDVSAGGAGVTLSITGVADQYWVIDSVHCGYDAPLTGTELLSISFAGVAKFKIPFPVPTNAGVNQQGLNEIIWPRGLYTGVLNQTVLIGLSAGGGAILAYISATYR